MPCAKFKRKSLRQSAASPDSGEYTIETLSRMKESATKKKACPLRGSACVELLRNGNSTLGIGLSGGVDKGFEAFISCLRPGSIAFRSDKLQLNDVLTAVNGLRVLALRHDEILTLLRNAGERVRLDVEYDLNDICFERPINTFCRATEITLEKEGGSFGFTIRGGAYGPDTNKSRPITVTAVRPGGPADRESRLRAGDRLLSINGIDVFSATLSAACRLLVEAHSAVSLGVEYDVSLLETVKHACGPLLLEIDKPPGCELGVSLTIAENAQAKRCLFIENVAAASIADRCGALHTGDEILAIDGIGLEYTTLAEARQLLKGCAQTPRIRLEIVPHSQMEPRALDADENKLTNGCARHSSYRKQPHRSSDRAAKVKRKTVRAKSHDRAMSPTDEDGRGELLDCRGSAPTLVGHHSRFGGDVPSLRSSTRSCSNGGGRQWQRPSLGSLSASMSGVPCGQVCHSEVMEVVLHSYARGGFGIIVHRQHGFADAAQSPLFVSYIERGSPAEKSGVLQVGDRILAINQWCTGSGSAEEANYIIRHAASPLSLTVEFDVIETVLPSSGVFTVKLAKRGQNLGVIIRTSNDDKKGEPVVISDIRTGSVAHRCGSIHPGDRVLAIDNIPLDTCSVGEAVRLLQRSSDIVKLRVKKSGAAGADDADSAFPQTVVYSVELSRRGGPLGITISSTADRSDPIVISHLAPGGLADRTGALHVSDRLLAINGKSLQGKGISEALQMLHGTGDSVSLKVSRCIALPNNLAQTVYRPLFDSPAPLGVPLYCEHVGDHDTTDKLGTPIQSIDSAVESLEDSPLAELNSTARPSRGYLQNNAHNELHLKYAEELGVHLRRSLPDYRADAVNHPSGGGAADAAGAAGRGVELASTSSDGQPSDHGCDSGMGSSEAGNGADTCCGCTCQSDFKSSDTNAGEEWIRVLEALETVGEAEMLRKLEDSIMSGSVPICDHGSQCRASAGAAPTKAVLAGDQRLIRPPPFPVTNTILRHPHMSASTHANGAALGSNLSLSSSSSDPTVGNKRSPAPAPPPKPPHPILSPATALAASNSWLRGCENIPYISSPLPPDADDRPSCSTADDASPLRLCLPPQMGLLGPADASPLRAGSLPIEIHRVTLRKDRAVDDFGFSVSDGELRKGVYINKVRPGGPADVSGNVKPYDRILQVNGQSLESLDCNLAVPILQSTSDQIELLICRNPSSSAHSLPSVIAEEEELKDSAV